MELTWSTFVLEIINFLVLVWILKRFLYKPVLEIIARRQAQIEKTLADAKHMETEAKTLQDRYESRLADWDTERKQAREDLTHELDDERAKRLAELRDRLEAERKSAQVAETRRLTDLRRQLEETALAHGAHFASRLLEGAAGPELQARFVEQVRSELAELPAEQLADLRGNPEDAPTKIVVTSAFSLSSSERDELSRALSKLTQLDIPVEFEERSELLAGIRITIGAWVLGLNLQDELEGFARLRDGSLPED